MGKLDDQRKLKLCVLNKIKENKRVLFGAFCDTLSKGRLHQRQLKLTVG
jgi:hypothetical protein